MYYFWQKIDSFDFHILFNKYSYFEFFFQAPPPAALEFLTKIREVIATAKLKLSAKRFLPSLLNIPEEDNYYIVETVGEILKAVSRQSSIVSLKRENSRRKTCTGCPGCETNNSTFFGPKLSEIPELFGCHTCTSTSIENKQRSIRKWLEDVPVVKDGNNSPNPEIFSRATIGSKRVRSPTRFTPDKINPVKMNAQPLLLSSENPSSEFNGQREKTTDSIFSNPEEQLPEENIYDTVSEDGVKGGKFPLPEPIKKENVNGRIDTLTKKQMNAVINEFTVQKSLIIPQINQRNGNPIIEYETDSLERKKIEGK